LPPPKGRNLKVKTFFFFKNEKFPPESPHGKTLSPND